MDDIIERPQPTKKEDAYIDKNRATYIFFVFFLSWLGGHNFYIRQYLSGMMKIVLFLALSILDTNWVLTVISIAYFFFIAIDVYIAMSYKWKDGNEGKEIGYVLSVIIFFIGAIILLETVGAFTNKVNYDPDNLNKLIFTTCQKKHGNENDFCTCVTDLTILELDPQEAEDVYHNITLNKQSSNLDYFLKLYNQSISDCNLITSE